MKNYLYLVISALMLIYGCSENSTSSEENNIKTMGKVSINIDRTNAPASVSFVIANLIKAGSDTLTGYMNLSTDTSAGINFQNVSTGTWDLVVLAEDNSGQVLYKGEASVKVSSGITTLVSLTLSPVPQSTGNIEIKVSWESYQPLFTDYLSNPVYSGSDNPSNPIIVSQSKVLYENGVYKLWYKCVYNAAAGSAWYAESSDGISWSNKYNAPVLSPGQSGSWDDLYVDAGAVINDNGVYKMYYNGGRSGYNNYYIGLAISTDGVSWQKSSTPVLSHEGTSDYYNSVQSVIKVGNTYFMYYSSSPQYNYDQFSIKLAVSNDGINWSKYNNPVISPTLSWEGIGVFYPSVIYDNNQFVMVYSNSQRNALGMAYSNDGIHWTKKCNKPIYSVSVSYPQSDKVEYPNFVKINGEYRVYYTSTVNNNVIGIALARTNRIR